MNISIKRFFSPMVSIYAILLILLFYQMRNLHTQFAPQASSSPELQSTPRHSKLGDGCYHVFLDLGSNIGIHGRFLFEPQHYPNSKSSVATLAQEFGPIRDNRDFCVFAFEPNPKFEKKHLELAAAYEAMGWRYHPMLAGVSNHDGNMTFYHTHMEHEDIETGFSAVAPKTLRGYGGTQKNVKILRLATWIQNEIQDRIIPKFPHGWYPHKGPRVVMKLDVEGLEYRVFPDLLTTGALCSNIHFLFGEFHYNGDHHVMFPMNITADGKHVIKDRNEARRMAQSLLNLKDISENCMTNITAEDDESYLFDTVAYPKPSNISSSKH